MGPPSAPGPLARLRPGRLYVWLGTALALLGPAAYAAQYRAKVLTVPWYLPVLGSVGAALALVALVRARTITRGAALLFLSLLAGAEWLALLAFTVLPAYAGPVAVGSAFPAFTTTLADGSPFNQDGFREGSNTVLVFFRGRW